ncbi:MAG: PLP-dependent aminotransferase family protein [Alphaproteobacteria bacterium]
MDALAQARIGRSALPLYRDIYERIRDAILSGQLRPGDRLPSARSLAAQLTIARGTVDAAYQTLAGEGYLVGRGAGGTIVDPALDLGPRARTAAEPRETEGPFTGLAVERGGAPLTFQMGIPALDVFPLKQWSRIAHRAAHAITSADLVYQDPAGQRALREAIAAYLRIARGLHSLPGQVFITAGHQGALGLITHTLLKRGEKVWVEDPGYFLAHRALALAGARLVPVPVDGEGMVVAAGIKRAPRARFALVTPSHQFPFGATMPVARRMALLDWASQADAWIVEDDYDSEFRHGGRPPPALKSLDRDDRVLYTGTFSKVLFPGLRVGYLIAPASLVAALREGAEMLHPAPAALNQLTIARFMADGHFARHVKKMRQLYAARRSALLDALRHAFRHGPAVAWQAGGMHIVGRMAAGTDDVALVRRARSKGLGPAPLSICSQRRPATPGLLVGFTNVPVEAARASAVRLREAIV